MQYYCFGCGVNGIASIEFFGYKDCIAIVDNSKKVIGKKYKDIDIICFDEFRCRWKGETILITPYLHIDEIKKQLEDASIYSYFICPHMFNGFYSSVDEMIYVNEIDKQECVYLYGENILSQLIYERIRQSNLYKELFFVRDTCYKNDFFSGCKVIDLSEIESGPIFVLTIENERELRKAEDQRLVFVLSNYNKKNDELVKFKGMFNKKRVFLVGNGASLRMDDLEQLHKTGATCFGCNHIMKSFAYTNWRPKYYFLAHTDMLLDNQDIYKTMLDNGAIFFCRNIYPFPHIDEYLVDRICFYNVTTINDSVDFSDDISKVVFSSSTVMYDMLQFAIYMGAEEIILIGCDCDYGKGNNKHFYLENCMPNDGITAGIAEIHLYERWFEFYKEARIHAENRGIRILNATRGGSLEVFERVDMGSLL